MDDSTCLALADRRVDIKATQLVAKSVVGEEHYLCNLGEFQEISARVLYTF
jgi:hypothetical protein